MLSAPKDVHTDLPEVYIPQEDPEQVDFEISRKEA
jgi:hypothetical protein